MLAIAERSPMSRPSLAKPRNEVIKIMLEQWAAWHTHAYSEAATSPIAGAIAAAANGRLIASKYRKPHPMRWPAPGKVKQPGQFCSKPPGLVEVPRGVVVAMQALEFLRTQHGKGYVEVLCYEYLIRGQVMKKRRVTREDICTLLDISESVYRHWRDRAELVFESYVAGQSTLHS